MLPNSSNHLSIVLSKQSLNKRIVHIKRSRSVFICYSLNIVFQTIFCIFSMSCSWVGLLIATGYSPKYMKCLLHLAWTSFVLKTTCECSSRSNDTPFKKTCSATKLFRMARSHFMWTTLWELAFPNSHMAACPANDTTQVTQTIDHGLTACAPISMGRSGSVIFSLSSYPKWVV